MKNLLRKRFLRISKNFTQTIFMLTTFVEKKGKGAPLLAIAIVSNREVV
jgi:hypothetical protein